MPAINYQIDFVSTVAEQLGAQLFFPGAAPVRGPGAAEIADFAWFGKLRQLGQRFGENDLATLSIVRRPKSPADGMIDESGAGWRDGAHDVMSRADHQGRNAPAFDHVGDETDGLMAKWSVGHEQCEVDLRLRQLIGQGKREIALDFLVPAHAAHE